MTKVQNFSDKQQKTQVSINLDVQQAISMMQSLASALDLLDYGEGKNSITHRNMVAYLLQLNSLLAQSLDQIEFEISVTHNFNH